MPKYYSLDDVEAALPEYSIVEHKASGGFKDVFLAEKDGNSVVVKLIPVGRPSRRQRAEREADAMQKIDSPHFVNLLDYDELLVGGEPTFLLVEELIDGPTLREVIDRGDVGAELGLQVANVIVDLLIQFDKLDIIHRDIKPQNIMLDENGNIVLLDVGIVRFEERESVTPDHLDRLGTPNYGAPEQLDYDKELQSPRIDIFSTGIVMFESIMGAHPYDNRQTPVSEAIAEGNKSELTNILDNAEADEMLSELFENMTETEPYARIRKAEFVRDDLQEIEEAM